MVLPFGIQQTSAGDVLPIEEFARFDEADQIAYLRETVLEYCRTTNNISVTGTVFGENRNYDPRTRQIGDEVLLLTRRNDYEMRRIGDSYLVSHQEVPPVRKPGVSYPLVVETYDSNAGRRRQLDTVDRDDRPSLYFGTVGPERGTAAAGCFFYQYFGDHSEIGGGALGDPGTHYLRGFEHARVTAIDEDAGTVQVTFPSAMPWRTDATCVETFDFSRDALIIRMELTEHTSSPSGPVEKRRYDVQVVEAQQIDEAWIPMMIQQIVWTASDPEAVTLWEGMLEEVSLNELTMDDLSVEFPAGTEVKDRFTGERYTVAADGSYVASTIRPASSADTSGPAMQVPGSTDRRWMTWGLTMGNVLVITGILVYTARRKRSARN